MNNHEANNHHVGRRLRSISLPLLAAAIMLVAGPAPSDAAPLDEVSAADQAGEMKDKKKKDKKKKNKKKKNKKKKGNKKVQPPPDEPPGSGDGDGDKLEPLPDDGLKLNKDGDCALASLSLAIDTSRTLLQLELPGQVPLNVWGGTYELVFPADGSGLDITVRPLTQTQVHGQVVGTQGEGPYEFMWDADVATVHIPHPADPTKTEFSVTLDDSTKKAKSKDKDKDKGKNKLPAAKLILKPVGSCPPPT